MLAEVVLGRSQPALVGGRARLLAGVAATPRPFTLIAVHQPNAKRLTGFQETRKAPKDQGFLFTCARIAKRKLPGLDSNQE